MLDESTLAIYQRMKLPLVAARGKAYFSRGVFMPTPYSFLFEWKRQVGLLCGCEFGRGKLVVMDVDPRNGGDDSLTRLCERFGDLPYTARQTTPSGGQHFFFVAPTDLGFPHDLSDFELPGIDIIADPRHFVLIAPSVYKRKPYEWQVPIWEHVAECPEHLLCFARAWSRKDEDRPSEPFVESRPQKTSQPLAVRGKQTEKPREVVTDPRRHKALVEDLVRRFPISAGRRDNQTARAVGSLVGRGYLSEPVLYEYLKHFEAQFTMPLSMAFAKAKRMMRRMPKAAVVNHIEETMKRDLELADRELAVIERAGSKSQEGFLRAVLIHRRYRQERDQKEREKPQGLVNGRAFTPLEAEGEGQEGEDGENTQGLINGRAFTPLGQHAATNETWKTLMRDLGYGWPSDVTIEKHKRRFITRKGFPAKEFEVLTEVRKGIPGVASLYADGAVWL